jgi:hypothetical protein
VAQLGARVNGIHEVTGSIPVRSTNFDFLALVHRLSVRSGVPTYSAVVVGVASRLLKASPIRLVVLVGRDGSMTLRSEGPIPERDPLPPDALPPGVEMLGDEPTLVTVRIPASLPGVRGAADEPDTLFALHDLAFRHPLSRLIVSLPPEHVGRRW